MIEDHTKKAILRRRAQFIAASLAGASVMACEAGPSVCLNPAELPDTSTVDADSAIDSAISDTTLDAEVAEETADADASEVDAHD